VSILWEVENCPFPLTKPVAVNTGLALPRSLWQGLAARQSVLLVERQHMQCMLMSHVDYLAHSNWTLTLFTLLTLLTLTNTVCLCSMRPVIYILASRTLNLYQRSVKLLSMFVALVLLSNAGLILGDPPIFSGAKTPKFHIKTPR